MLAPPDRQSLLVGVGRSFAASRSEVGPFTWFELVFGACGFVVGVGRRAAATCSFRFVVIGVGTRNPVSDGEPSRIVASEDLRASAAVGVGIIALPSDLPPWPFRPDGPFMSIAVGVGSRRTASVRLGPRVEPVRRLATFPEPFMSIAVGVGRSRCV